MERLAAETLRLILDTMVEGVVLHDAEGDVAWANSSAARILGPSVLISARTSGGSDAPWSAIREDGEPWPWAEHPAMAALRSGIPRRDVIMGIERPDGVRRWVSVNAEPVQHGAGQQPTAVVVTYADITAIREGALKLKALESQLRHAQKMEAVGQLTGGIAHDFNNLLTAILTNADLLTDAVSGAEAVDELNDLRRAARRGADLVRKLMVFARRDRPELTRLDLAEQLYDAARLLRRVVPESIEIQTSVQKGLPAIQADPASLEQVLVNLATNARDAMPAGGVLRLQAELRMLEAAESERIGWGRPGPYVSLTVSDNGTGMDAATLQRIFDPFFTTKPVGSGTGLGMSIVYGAVQQHGGHIVVTSVVNEGTRVELCFLPAEVQAAPDEPDETAEVRGGNETVLLVEDNESVRAAARRILERRGYRVLSATTGDDALQLFEVHRNSVALILADVVMPRMGGFDLVRAVRRLGADPRFLLTSGYTQRPGDAAELQVPILAKPWTPVVLASKVREVLDGAAVSKRQAT